MKTLNMLSVPLIFHGHFLVEYEFSRSCDAEISIPDFCPDNVPVNSLGMLLCEKVDINSA